MSHPWPGGSAHILLQKKSSLWGCTKTRKRPEARAALPLASLPISSSSAQSLFPSFQLSVLCILLLLGCHTQAPVAAMERNGESLEPLLSFDYITLALGESRFSFKLSNLFPFSSQACAGLSALSSLFPESSGVPCPHPIWPFFSG